VGQPDRDGEAAHVAKAAMSTPLRCAAQVAARAANPAPPPASMSRRPTRPRARAPLRADGDVRGDALRALALSVNTPQAALQLGLGDATSGGPMGWPWRVGESVLLSRLNRPRTRARARA